MRLEFDLPQKFEQALFSMGKIYNHPETSEHLKHFIIFELQKILGNEYDIIGFLKEDECQYKEGE